MLKFVWNCRRNLVTHLPWNCRPVTNQNLERKIATTKKNCEKDGQLTEKRGKNGWCKFRRIWSVCVCIILISGPTGGRAGMSSSTECPDSCHTHQLVWGGSSRRRRRWWGDGYWRVFICFHANVHSEHMAHSERTGIESDWQTDDSIDWQWVVFWVSNLRRYFFVNHFLYWEIENQCSDRLKIN